MIEGNRRFLRLLLMIVLCASVAPREVLADDDDKASAPEAARATNKLVAPRPGLTERERWLLE